MSTERHNRIAIPFDPETPDRRCCYCGHTRPPGRRRWCSASCVDDFLVRKGDATRIRHLLAHRDQRVCQRCGFDTKPLARLLYRLAPSFQGNGPAPESYFWLKQQLGIDRYRLTLWDADHIVAVVEGGGGCGLDNYRTLCLWCHKDVTAQLQSRRAVTRRDAARPLLRLMEASMSP